MKFYEDDDDDYHDGNDNYMYYILSALMYDQKIRNSYFSFSFKTMFTKH